LVTLIVSELRAVAGASRMSSASFAGTIAFAAVPASRAIVSIIIRAVVPIWAVTISRASTTATITAVIVTLTVSVTVTRSTVNNWAAASSAAIAAVHSAFMAAVATLLLTVIISAGVAVWLLVGCI
jgi:hypothetical protein